MFGKRSAKHRTYLSFEAGNKGVSCSTVMCCQVTVSQKNALCLQLQLDPSYKERSFTYTQYTPLLLNTLQQDGDAITLTSRWSCQPSLGPEGSTCLITYSLGDTQTIESVNIGESHLKLIKYTPSCAIQSWGGLIKQGPVEILFELHSTSEALSTCC